MQHFELTKGSTQLTKVKNYYIKYASEAVRLEREIQALERRRNLYMNKAKATELQLKDAKAKFKNAKTTIDYMHEGKLELKDIEDDLANSIGFELKEMKKSYKDSLAFLAQ